MVIVSSLGILLLVGFILACFVVWRKARDWALSEEKVLDIFFSTTFSALLVGRVVYVLTAWSVFGSDISRAVLFLKYPGVSLLAILVTGIVSSAVLAKLFSLPVLLIWDIFALAAALFSVFASFGCLLDGCANFPWALLSLPFILALLLLVAFAFLQRMFSKLPQLSQIAKRHGIFFLCYLIFALLSLLMTRWPTLDWGNILGYSLGIVGLIVIFLIRYQDLFAYVLSAISQRRPGAS